MSDAVDKLIWAFTGVQVPQADPAVMLLLADELRAVARRVDSELHPDLVSLIQAAGSATKGPAGRRFVAQTSRFATSDPQLLAQASQHLGAASLGLERMALQVDYTAKQAQIMALFTLFELAIAAVEAFWDPAGAAARIATTRSIVRTVMSVQRLKVAAHVLAMQMLFMPGSSLVAQVWQILEGKRSDIDGDEIGHMAEYAAAGAAVTALGGAAAARKLFDSVQKAAQNIGIRAENPLLDIMTSAVASVGLEAGASVFSGGLVDGNWSAGLGDVVSGAVEGGGETASRRAGRAAGLARGRGPDPTGQAVDLSSPTIGEEADAPPVADPDILLSPGVPISRNTPLDPSVQPVFADASPSLSPAPARAPTPARAPAPVYAPAPAPAPAPAHAPAPVHAPTPAPGTEFPPVSSHPHVPASGNGESAAGSAQVRADIGGPAPDPTPRTSVAAFRPADTSFASPSMVSATSPAPRSAASLETALAERYADQVVPGDCLHRLQQFHRLQHPAAGVRTATLDEALTPTAALAHYLGSDSWTSVGPSWAPVTDLINHGGHGTTGYVYAKPPGQPQHAVVVTNWYGDILWAELQERAGARVQTIAPLVPVEARAIVLGPRGDVLSLPAVPTTTSSAATLAAATSSPGMLRAHRPDAARSITPPENVTPAVPERSPSGSGGLEPADPADRAVTPVAVTPVAVTPVAVTPVAVTPVPAAAVTALPDLRSVLGRLSARSAGGVDKVEAAVRELMQTRHAVLRPQDAETVRQALDEDFESFTDGGREFILTSGPVTGPATGGKLRKPNRRFVATIRVKGWEKAQPLTDRPEEAAHGRTHARSEFTSDVTSKTTGIGLPIGFTVLSPLGIGAALEAGVTVSRTHTDQVRTTVTDRVKLSVDGTLRFTAPVEFEITVAPLRDSPGVPAPGTMPLKVTAPQRVDETAEVLAPQDLLEFVPSPELLPPVPVGRDLNDRIAGAASLSWDAVENANGLFRRRLALLPGGSTAAGARGRSTLENLSTTSSLRRDLAAMLDGGVDSPRLVARDGRWTALRTRASVRELGLLGTVGESTVQSARETRRLTTTTRTDRVEFDVSAGPAAGAGVGPISWLAARVLPGYRYRSSRDHDAGGAVEEGVSHEIKQRRSLFRAQVSLADQYFDPDDGAWKYLPGEQGHVVEAVMSLAVDEAAGLGLPGPPGQSSMLRPRPVGEPPRRPERTAALRVSAPAGTSDRLMDRVQVLLRQVDGAEFLPGQHSLGVSRAQALRRFHNDREVRRLLSPASLSSPEARRVELKRPGITGHDTLEVTLTPVWSWTSAEHEGSWENTTVTATDATGRYGGAQRSTGHQVDTQVDLRARFAVANAGPGIVGRVGLRRGASAGQALEMSDRAQLIGDPVTEVFSMQVEYRISVTRKPHPSWFTRKTCRLTASESVDVPVRLIVPRALTTPTRTVTPTAAGGPDDGQDVAPATGALIERGSVLTVPDAQRVAAAAIEAVTAISAHEPGPGLPDWGNREFGSQVLKLVAEGGERTRRFGDVEVSIRVKAGRTRIVSLLDEKLGVAITRAGSQTVTFGKSRARFADVQVSATGRSAAWGDFGIGTIAGQTGVARRQLDTTTITGSVDSSPGHDPLALRFLADTEVTYHVSARRSGGRAGLDPSWQRELTGGLRRMLTEKQARDLGDRVAGGLLAPVDALIADNDAVLAELRPARPDEPDEPGQPVAAALSRRTMGPAGLTFAPPAYLRGGPSESLGAAVAVETPDLRHLLAHLIQVMGPHAEHVFPVGAHDAFSNRELVSSLLEPAGVAAFLNGNVDGGTVLTLGAYGRRPRNKLRRHERKRQLAIAGRGDPGSALAPARDRAERDAARSRRSAGLNRSALVSLVIELGPAQHVDTIVDGAEPTVHTHTEILVNDTRTTRRQISATATGGWGRVGQPDEPVRAVLSLTPGIGWSRTSERGQGATGVTLGSSTTRIVGPRARFTVPVRQVELAVELPDGRVFSAGEGPDASARPAGSTQPARAPLNPLLVDVAADTLELAGSPPSTSPVANPTAGPEVSRIHGRIADHISRFRDSGVLFPARSAVERLFGSTQIRDVLLRGSGITHVDPTERRSALLTLGSNEISRNWIRFAAQESGFPLPHGDATVYARLRNPRAGSVSTDIRFTYGNVDGVDVSRPPAATTDTIDLTSTAANVGLGFAPGIGQRGSTRNDMGPRVTGARLTELETSVDSSSTGALESTGPTVLVAFDVDLMVVRGSGASATATTTTLPAALDLRMTVDAATDRVAYRDDAHLKATAKALERASLTYREHRRAEYTAARGLLTEPPGETARRTELRQRLSESSQRVRETGAELTAALQTWVVARNPVEAGAAGMAPAVTPAAEPPVLPAAWQPAGGAGEGPVLVIGAGDAVTAMARHLRLPAEVVTVVVHGEAGRPVVDGQPVAVDTLARTVTDRLSHAGLLGRQVVLVAPELGEVRLTPGAVTPPVAQVVAAHLAERDGAGHPGVLATPESVWIVPSSGAPVAGTVETDRGGRLVVAPRRDLLLFRGPQGEAVPAPECVTALAAPTDRALEAEPEPGPPAPWYLRHGALGDLRITRMRDLSRAEAEKAARVTMAGLEPPASASAWIGPGTMRARVQDLPGLEGLVANLLSRGSRNERLGRLRTELIAHGARPAELSLRLRQLRDRGRFGAWTDTEIDDLVARLTDLNRARSLAGKVRQRLKGRRSPAEAALLEKAVSDLHDGDGEQIAEKNAEEWNTLLRTGEHHVVNGHVVWLRPVLRDVAETAPSPAAQDEPDTTKRLGGWGTSVEKTTRRTTKRWSVGAKVADILSLASRAAAAIMPMPFVSAALARLRSDTTTRIVVGGLKPFTEAASPFSAGVAVQVHVDGERWNTPLTGSAGNVFETRIADVALGSAPADDGTEPGSTPPGGAHDPDVSLDDRVLTAIDPGPLLREVQQRLLRNGSGAKAVSRVSRELMDEVLGEHLLINRGRIVQTQGERTGRLSAPRTPGSLLRLRGADFDGDLHFDFRAITAQRIGYRPGVAVRDDLRVSIARSSAREPAGSEGVGAGPVLGGPGTPDAAGDTPGVLGSVGQETRESAVNTQDHTVLTRRDDQVVYRGEIAVTVSSRASGLEPFQVWVDGEFMVPSSQTAEFERTLLHAPPVRHPVPPSGMQALRAHVRHKVSAYLRGTDEGPDPQETGSAPARERWRVQDRPRAGWRPSDEGGRVEERTRFADVPAGPRSFPATRRSTAPGEEITGRARLLVPAHLTTTGSAPKPTPDVEMPGDPRWMNSHQHVPVAAVNEKVGPQLEPYSPTAADWSYDYADSNPARDEPPSSVARFEQHGENLHVSATLGFPSEAHWPVVPFGYAGVLLHGRDGMHQVRGRPVHTAEVVTELVRHLRTGLIPHRGVVLYGCTLGAAPATDPEQPSLAQALVNRLPARPDGSRHRVLASPDDVLISHSGRVFTGGHRIVRGRIVPELSGAFHVYTAQGQPSTAADNQVIGQIVSAPPAEAHGSGDAVTDVWWKLSPDRPGHTAEREPGAPRPPSPSDSRERPGERHPFAVGPGHTPGVQALANSFPDPRPGRRPAGQAEGTSDRSGRLSEVAKIFTEAVERVSGGSPWLAGGAALHFQSGARTVNDLDFQISPMAISDFHSAEGRRFISDLNREVHRLQGGRNRQADQAVLRAAQRAWDSSASGQELVREAKQIKSSVKETKRALKARLAERDALQEQEASPMSELVTRLNSDIGDRQTELASRQAAAEELQTRFEDERGRLALGRNTRPGAALATFALVGRTVPHRTIGTKNWRGEEVSLSLLPALAGQMPRSTVNLDLSVGRPIRVTSLPDLRNDKLKAAISRRKNGNDSVSKVTQDLFDYLDATILLDGAQTSTGGDFSVDAHVDTAAAARSVEYASSNLDGDRRLADEERPVWMRSRLILTARATRSDGERLDYFDVLVQATPQVERRAQLRARLEHLADLPVRADHLWLLEPWMHQWVTQKSPPRDFRWGSAEACPRADAPSSPAGPWPHWPTLRPAPTELTTALHELGRDDGHEPELPGHTRPRREAESTADLERTRSERVSDAPGTG